MSKGFEIIITGPIYRKELVAEIWYNERVVAELISDYSEITAMLYPNVSPGVPLDEFIEILMKAKKQLHRIG